MGGKGPDGGQWSDPTLTPEARQRVEDSQKSVFDMFTQLRGGIPESGNPTQPQAQAAPTQAASTPVNPSTEGGEIAEPSQPSGGAAATTTTPDTSTGGLLATTMTSQTPQTPSNFWTDLGAKTKKPPVVTQT